MPIKEMMRLEFLYTLGEVFKRLLNERDCPSIDFGGNDIQKNLIKVQDYIKSGFIVIINAIVISEKFLIAL